MASLWTNEMMNAVLVDNWRDIVRQYYIARNLSASELIRKSGVARATFYKILSGKNVKYTTIEKLAVALEFDMQTLFRPQFKKPLTKP